MTYEAGVRKNALLYHTKSYDACSRIRYSTLIIPYQELLGNYDLVFKIQAVQNIIPYQELLGNYDDRHETEIFW